METIVSQKMSRGQGNELLNKLEAAGLSDEFAQKVIDSKGNKLAAKVVRLIKYGGFEPFTTKTLYFLAQSFLGADFITPEEITKARPSIIYTDDQITALAESLPSEDILKWCKDYGYAVMPAPPTAMSVLDVQEIQSVHFHSKMCGWYDDEKFAREDKVSFGWLLVKKTSVRHSTDKIWRHQKDLSRGYERVPNAAEMSWFITTYFEVRGIRLFENIYVRTTSLNSGGDRVYVGFFSAEGMHVKGYLGDSDHYVTLGLAAAIKNF